MSQPIEDIEYVRHDDTPLLARLYRAVGDRPFPAVVDVHGGAWTVGDRLSNVAIDMALAARGIVVLSLDFRMPPEAVYPASVADVNLGIRWLKQHALEFGSREDLVGGVGTSSGGNTLLLNVVQPFDPRYAGIALPSAPEVNARLEYAVVCWPVSDPLARYRMAVERNYEKLVAAHDEYWASTQAMSEGNPQLILERGKADSLPPLLIVQGTNDDNVTPDMAERLSTAYHAAGGDVRLEMFPGEPHSFIKDSSQSAAAKALDIMSAFIHESCRRPETA